MKKCFSVAWGLDKKYVLQAFVVMKSILVNSDSYYNFYILSGDDISCELKEFEELLKKEHNNFSLLFCRIDVNLFNNAKIFNEHISCAAYNRLPIPQVIKSDKCLYLDCDVLVNCDISELFQIDIEEYYVAGVKDNNLIVLNDSRKKHLELLELPDVDTYINSGVMLMNLKKMRTEGVVHSFLEQCKKNNLFEDQDVINKCCYGNIKLIPLKYNLFHFYSGKCIKTLFSRDYSIEDFNFDWNAPKILHMGGKYKPWNNRYYKGAREWWDYAKTFCSTQAYKRYYETCGMGGIVNQKEYIETLMNAKNVYIWGVSARGKSLYEICLNKGIEVSAFIDRDEKYKNMSYEGIPIVTPESIDSYEKSIFLLGVANAENVSQVVECLTQNGVERKYIITKDMLVGDVQYYMSIAPEYIDIVLDDIESVEKQENEEWNIHEVITNPNEFPCIYYHLYNAYSFNIWLD